MDCPKGENYHPCRCDNAQPDVLPPEIHCDSFASIAEIAQVFRKTTRSHLIYSFKLTAPEDADELDIPDNFLARHRINDSILLICAGRLTGNNNRTIPTKLSIHPDAFSASRDTLKGIFSNDCDFDNLTFLTGFRNLEVFNFHFYNRPDDKGPIVWDGIAFLSALMKSSLPILSSNRIKQIVFYGVEFGDEEADRTVQWVLDSASETLQLLMMAGTKLTRIPSAISNFKHLKKIYRSHPNYCPYFECFCFSSVNYWREQTIIEL